MRTSLVILIGLLCLSLDEARAGTILTFADLSQAGASIALVDSPYSALGFSVSDSSLQFLMWQTESENYFGATALIPGFFDSITMLGRNDSGPFDFLSIDLAKVAIGITDPQTLLITGTFSDLSTVTQTCSILASATFSTCSFGPQFSNLSYVTWGTEALFQYTNIDVSADVFTPEPGTLGLLIIGVGCLLALKAGKAA